MKSSMSKNMKLVCDAIVAAEDGKRVLFVTERSNEIRMLFNNFDLSKINIENCKEGLLITKKL